MYLPDSERNIMEVLWENGAMHAKDVAAALKQKVNWSKTTTYTMLTRCMDKGYLKRSEPKFLCTPVLTKAEVSRRETETLLRHDYDGSADLLVAALVDQKKLSLDQMKKLCDMLQEKENKEK